MNTRLFLSLALGLAALACGGSDFDPQNMVQGVRILSTRADKPYAKPGESVSLEMLVADGRKDTSRPLKVLWFPFVCTNPPGDAYFGCFAPGAGAGAIAGLPKGVDLSSVLPNGTSYTFQMPDNAVQPHKGSAEPYGISFVFNIACAGRLVVTEIDASKGPQGVPLACVDEAGSPLGPDDYVIGYTRVFSYATRSNANPQIEQLTFDGLPVDPAQGVTVAPCAAAEAKDCPEHAIDVTLKAGAQEVNGNEKGADGTPLKEVVWATYYTTAGRFESDARLLFDSREGAVSGSKNKYFGKSEARSANLWVVVKDNRGGTDWLTIPLNVR